LAVGTRNLGQQWLQARIQRIRSEENLETVDTAQRSGWSAPFAGPTSGAAIVLPTNTDAGVPMNLSIPILPTIHDGYSGMDEGTRQARHLNHSLEY
jgi:hypothetical protein